MNSKNFLPCLGILCLTLGLMACGGKSGKTAASETTAAKPVVAA